MAATNSNRLDEPILVVRDTTKRFGNVLALDRVSLTVPRGDFVTLLGPSGSGKTTLLRIVAGLETPSEIVDLKISGQDVREIPANHRNVATVFQHYGLFPHMSVGKNIEYGLLVRKRPPAERRRRAMEALEMVRLPDKYDRRVHQLSGGERQRIALARALVTEPDILLLDEPLGALDERLRRDMQVELLRLQKSLGTTFILVTHSQEEALTMSGRIVLLNKGRIIQDGSPQDLFDRPQSRFVADFMGIENVLEGRVSSCKSGETIVAVSGADIVGQPIPGFSPSVGESVFLAIRAERLRISSGAAPANAGINSVRCKPRLRIYKGNHYDTELETQVGTLVCRQVDAGALPETGFALWDSRHCVIGPMNPSTRQT
ncbi:MAG: ABC transporter ATP-binding protein [Rhodospirillaceae bacterium]|nr:ABC transporter ATP-binding protein [Rhodospirillaceae bacterium]